MDANLQGCPNYVQCGCWVDENTHEKSKGFEVHILCWVYLLQRLPGLWRKVVFHLEPDAAPPGER